MDVARDSAMIRHVVLALLLIISCCFAKGFFSFFGGGKDEEESSEAANSQFSDSESASFFGNVRQFFICPNSLQIIKDHPSGSMLIAAGMEVWMGPCVKDTFVTGRLVPVSIPLSSARARKASKSA